MDDLKTWGVFSDLVVVIPTFVGEDLSSICCAKLLINGPLDGLAECNGVYSLLKGVSALESELEDSYILQVSAGNGGGGVNAPLLLLSSTELFCNYRKYGTLAGKLFSGNEVRLLGGIGGAGG